MIDINCDLFILTLYVCLSLNCDHRHTYSNDRNSNIARNKLAVHHATAYYGCIFLNSYLICHMLQYKFSKKSSKPLTIYRGRHTLSLSIYIYIVIIWLTHGYGSHIFKESKTGWSQSCELECEHVVVYLSIYCQLLLLHIDFYYYI